MSFSVDPARDINLMGRYAGRQDCRSRCTGWSGERVTIVEQGGRSQGLQLNCECCHAVCLHTAAVISTVLESKLVHGLSENARPARADRESD